MAFTIVELAYHLLLVPYFKFSTYPLHNHYSIMKKRPLSGTLNGQTKTSSQKIIGSENEGKRANRRNTRASAASRLQQSDENKEKSELKSGPKMAPVASVAPPLCGSSVVFASSDILHGSDKFLLKSEPDEFGVGHLERMKGSTGPWDGVRNMQARKFLTQMKIGDKAFFYHSSAGKATGIYGVVEIVQEAQADKSACDPKNKYYDENEERRLKWVAVEVKLVEKWKSPVLLSDLKKHEVLKNMMLFRNSRLSVQRVTDDEWYYICDKLKEK